MSPKREDPPSNLRSLETRISNIASDRGRPVRRMQRVIANTVVGQMLPPSVVKGGTAMKLRVGEAGSRFTPDLDAARSATVTLDDYIDELAARLARGWGGFFRRGARRRASPAVGRRPRVSPVRCYSSRNWDRWRRKRCGYWKCAAWPASG